MYGVHLALTVTPTSAPQVAISDALTLDADLEWTVHFDAAVAAGMAVSIDLSKPDGQPPVSVPVTVLAGSLATAIPAAAMTAPAPRVAAGVLPAAEVKTPQSTIVATPISVTPVQTPPAPIDVFVVGTVNQTPDAGAAQLHELLDAQHFTRGLAFVAPGTPTSNSDDGPAGFPTPDPGGAHSFAVERQAPQVVPNDGSDGDRFARALGLVAGGDEKSPVVEHVRRRSARTRTDRRRDQRRDVAGHPRLLHATDDGAKASMPRPLRARANTFSPMCAPRAP